MSEPPAPPPLVEQVLSGSSPELQLLAAEGLLPLPPAQVIPIQVFLARGPDAFVATRATASLRGLDPRVAATFLAQDASPEILSYFAETSEHPSVVEAIVRRRDVPPPLLADLAERLEPDLQEILLLRQDVIVEHPDILQRLEANPRVSSYTLRRIAEYREHLLPRAPVEEAAVETEEGPSAAEVAAAIDAARALPASGEVDEQTGLSETQVRALPLAVRLRLSRGASRALRSILIRDNNSLVAVSVMQNNAFSDQEVEHVARNRSVIVDVLEFIAARREWTRKYPIMLALVQNPRTPVAISVRLLPSIGVRDLRVLAKDKNVSDVVRSGASRLYRIKQV